MNEELSTLYYLSERNSGRMALLYKSQYDEIATAQDVTPINEEKNGIHYRLLLTANFFKYVDKYRLL